MAEVQGWGAQEDSARDYAYLSRRQDCRYLTHPKENPFMSLKKGSMSGEMLGLRHVAGGSECWRWAQMSP